MKNLENYGVQTLNAQEIRETEGGLFGIDDLTVLAIGLIIVAATAIVNDWDDFKTGISGNY